MNGIDIVHPNQISADLLPPQVILTDLRLLEESIIPNKEYDGVKILECLLPETQAINLSYKAKALTIEFSSFNFLESDRITYQYMLEGFDQKWKSAADAQHSVTYTNLNAGDYEFKVKAAGPNGIFNTNPTTLKIHIIPPIWDTLWFKILAVLLAIASVLGYTRYRVYMLRKQKMALERVVSERTEEIQEQRDAISYQAVELQKKNEELASNQEYIEGQNQKLEQSNQEVIKRRDELIELNKKLNLVSQLRLSFFTNISHEFRTPLTLIIGPLEKLLKNRQHDVETRNNLKLIKRNSKRLLHLIDEVMDFRKIERKKIDLKVSEGDFVRFSQKIVEAFEPLAAIKEIDFDFDDENFEGTVWFDRQNIEHILYNLLSNAFKYTPKEGYIRVRLDKITLADSKLKLSEEFEQNCPVVSLKIIDSGAGISEEDLPLIFKRFYRVESESTLKVGGSGIGLAITEELIKAHHGEIFVTSELGEGSVFEVQFPSLERLAHQQKTSPSEESSTLESRIEILKSELLLKNESSEDPIYQILDEDRNTLLLVEDNPDLRLFLAQHLQDAYNVIEASDGEQGWELAEKFNPDLIISDIMMPKKDGFELCKQIKEDISTSHIPVILLTAKSSVENQIEGFELGADDYLPKPFNFSLLEARIKNLIQSRKKLRAQFSNQEDAGLSFMSKHGNKDQQFLQEAIKQVEEHIDQADFGTNELVKNLGFSRSVVHKKLTALTDMSTTAFINYIRIQKAKELLKVGDMNISQIAYSVGYNDPKYFSRVFSKQIGKSPKQFQEMHLF